ncbi:MAG: 30s ribosomal protein S12 methylthiotransferase accessory protein YcaO [Candidatus Dactylopiibacterium carminicum]|uniref:30s ribosomal protein S12 methylthiotransferase accessory protein YcaO n=1 Tax=Candidatus Dactylopiibacterium carminicum TaxID=857335 RepID=A0A272EN16_9RHOO|nr:30S ribosomal protein S12 methylthiotransferase accessory factor YcaO [Candidatus Dactylopiibacterium carminicum]KAF7597933.1 30s ribosomal protein S12 methylthiotransferase accessory protein YcaO [Candidatus Dactylopiibacterium carminicum]PAS91507.1 MAG: 30s ribosomal protein S12 methylthiotransferase accessory protein YcaO [Candidatus Dactylopiibacterium carminicum]PAS93054.1 MAG: 30s ribosomal protein S12 methylthiotransferase accessory protein YcaO [Candidatus Dactylopiibacterium carminic
MSTSEHFIPGKDASLETTIGKLQAQLARLGFRAEEHCWLNPVEGVWSVHLRDADCPLIYTNGKGATELAARASALGEFFERLSCNYFWSHYYLGETHASGEFAHYPQERWFELDGEWDWPAGLLTPELRDFYNPGGEIDAEALVDLNTGNFDRGICTIPYVRQRDGETIYMPVNIVSNLYVSNGMAAGNTPAEARAQALSEILERHVKFKVIREGLCLPPVPEEIIARHPQIAAGIQGLRDAGFGVLVRDASLGGQFPVMNVTLLNPRDQGVFVSFGAHPRFEVALERALTELLQGRALAALDGFPPAGHDLEEVASVPNIEIHFVDSSGLVHWNLLGNNPDHEFVGWNFAGSTADDFAHLVDLIHTAGHEILIADFTHLGAHACRIIVPGMSEIYPLDELDFDNNSIGNDLRPSILNWQEMSEPECADLLEALNDIDLDEQKPVAALIGLAPDAGTLWEDLRVGELKCLLALAIGNEEAVDAGLHWVGNFSQLNPARRRVYSCIEQLLRLDDDERYMEALLGLYGEETLQLAMVTLSGELRFFGTPSPGLNLEGCVMHGKLLAAYAKVQALK